jgi:hypothetical protein
MQHLKLTPWQIAALSKLCRDELKRLADLPETPWANGVHELDRLFDVATGITVSRQKPR